MNPTMNNLARVSGAIDSFSEWTGRVLAWLTLAMVLVTFLVVVLRYAFNMGWIAMQESILYMHSLVFLGAAAYTLKHDGHVRVDIFYREMSPRAKAWVDLFGTLLLLMPTMGFLFYIAWEYVSVSWSLREGSREAGGIPGVYLLKTLIIVMPALVFAQGIADLLRSLLVIGGHTPPARQADAHPTTEEV